MTSFNDPGYREGRGVHTMNEDGSHQKRIVSSEELYELVLNKDKFSIDQMTVRLSERDT